MVDKGNLETKLKGEVYRILSGKEDAKKYAGNYIALRFRGKGFINGRVISYGEDPVKVVEEAKSKGYNEPVIFYVPKPNEHPFHVGV